MKICFLGSGTSQGIPVIGCKCDVCKSLDSKDKRLRSSVWIEHKGQSFVIDTSADFRQQMLRENVEKLDFVLLTHAHKDHIAGMDDVRSFNHLQHKPMNIYTDHRTCEAVMTEFHYAFSFNPYPGVPQLNLIPIENQSFTVENIEIVPISVIHFHLPILGFRIADFAYITDASYIDEKELEKMNGLKLLIINALRIDKHYSHFNLEEAIRISDKLKPQKTIFTHIGHQMGKYADINPTLPPTMELAYDQMLIEI
ncbi:MAG: MBL fold metallo-hydrolase [Bacteroidales bacterium]|jgi:phosphoribosyl 1,2-cyclic phosphate phosphodiesterase|nr:MBL fold metallo-hydrolase [Bacteroidales bacterium]